MPVRVPARVERQEGSWGAGGAGGGQARLLPFLMGNPDGAVTGGFLLLYNLVQASSSVQGFCQAVQEQEDGEGHNEDNKKDNDGRKYYMKNCMCLLKQSLLFISDLPNFLGCPIGSWVLFQLHCEDPDMDGLLEIACSPKGRPYSTGGPQDDRLLEKAGGNPWWANGSVNLELKVTQKSKMLWLLVRGFSLIYYSLEGTWHILAPAEGWGLCYALK